MSVMTFLVSFCIAPSFSTRNMGNRPHSSLPMKKFALTLAFSHTGLFWYTVSIPAARDSAGEENSTFLPSRKISPSSARWLPAMILIRVDLPAPLSPNRPSTSPLWTSKLTPFKASTFPKLFLTFLTSRTGVLPSVPFISLSSSLYPHRTREQNSARPAIPRFTQNSAPAPGPSSSRLSPPAVEM